MTLLNVGLNTQSALQLADVHSIWLWYQVRPRLRGYETRNFL